jgi:uncharacterized OsmC-like protein
MAKPTTPNLLEESGLPLFYPIRAEDERIPEVPGRDGHDVSVRSVVRSLTVMQKEALVANSGSPLAWRLSSDEGPYLAGHDFGPAPLTVTTAGLTADLMVQIRKAMDSADLPLDGLLVTLETHFTMEGSMLAGTMIGGANPPEVTVSTGAADRARAMDAVLSAVNASATVGLLHPSHTSLFTLTSSGVQIPVGRVAAVDDDAPKDPGTYFDSPEPRPDVAGPDIVIKLEQVETTAANDGSSLKESQSRSLYLRGRGSWRDDGVKEIDVELIRPSGSTFRILSDEAPGRGGSGRAPDALSLISAGLGFCFMTQIGRFAKIMKQDLGDYRIIQDTRFSVGDPTAAPPVGGRAEAPHTHVYLDPDGGDDFARTALDMSEQTCFLHAMCRTELRPKVRIVG